METSQLRMAFSELNGQRDVRIEFMQAHPLHVRRAFLIPEEKDGLVKLSDGHKIFVLDAARVAWIEIG